MAGSMVYRLQAGVSSQHHITRFREAMRAAQSILDNRSFNQIAGYHGAPSWWCWHHQHSNRTSLQARLFLPWHRAYLYTLEQALQDQLEGASIPWWDYTSGGIPESFLDRQVDGADNPLFGYEMRIPATRRNPAINRGTIRNQDGRGHLPSQSELTSLISDSDYASFNDRLESLHDGIHVWVGGDMREVTTAAFDPLFWAHHASIDRIWYLWQVRHGSGGIPRQLLRHGLEPFGMTVEDTLDVQALGYEYAITSTTIEQ